MSDPPSYPMGTTDTPSGRWTHTALTWTVEKVGDVNKAVATVYLDGDAGVPVTIEPFQNNSVGLDDWLIGGENFASRSEQGNTDTIRILDGQLADFAIYDAALTEEQIQQVMQYGVASASAALWAGDADMNLRFDQFDLVRVQQASLYMSGQPATWGEGDWNGAPGGDLGSPPPGDGVFNQFDIIAANTPGHYLSGPYTAVVTGGRADDAQTSVIYRASTGELSVDPPSGVQLTSINIESASGIFTGDPAQNLGGSFDNDADNNIFKATFGGSFGAISFGNVAQPGLSQQVVLGDLTVVGSLAGGGSLGDVDLVYIPVPEPSTLVLVMLGVLAAGASARRR